MKDEWIVHPNRSEIGPNKPGRNGHYRATNNQAERLPQETFQARVRLPQQSAHLGDDHGAVLFTGHTWNFVTGAARSFARRHFNNTTVRPFGFQRDGQWMYWDGTVTNESRLEVEEPTALVEQYLHKLFPGATRIEVSDLSRARVPASETR